LPNKADDAEKKDGKADPHEKFSPSAEEPDEAGIISVPAAPVVMGEKRVGRFLRIGILPVERLG